MHKETIKKSKINPKLIIGVGVGNMVGFWPIDHKNKPLGMQFYGMIQEANQFFIRIKIFLIEYIKLQAQLPSLAVQFLF